jgi:hypothetical protein
LRGADSGSGTLPDPYLILRDADGNYVDENDDYNSLDSLLIFTPDTTAAYFIDAGELGSGLITRI